jgi:hypothetical protein
LPAVCKGFRVFVQGVCAPRQRKTFSSDRWPWSRCERVWGCGVQGGCAPRDHLFRAKLLVVELTFLDDAVTLEQVGGRVGGSARGLPKGFQSGRAPPEGRGRRLPDAAIARRAAWSRRGLG